MDPLPPVEYEVTEILNAAILRDRKFTIAHLEKQQSVQFRFVVAGDLSGGISVYPFNAEGDVEVLPGAISKARDDRTMVERFAFLFVLSSMIVPAFNRVPGPIGELVGSLAYLLFALELVPCFQRSDG